MPRIASVLVPITLALGLACAAPGFAAWVPDGTLVPDPFPGDPGPITCAPDGAGGVVVSWGWGWLFASRLSAQGDIAPGWPPTGVPVQRYPHWGFMPLTVPDGLGGAFVVFSAQNCLAHCGADPSELRAQHVTAAGGIAEGWGGSGVAVGSGFGPQQRSYGYANTVALADGRGGQIVVWASPVAGGAAPPVELRAQRIDPSGTPRWGPAGILVRSVTAHPLLHAAASDGEGGAILSWQDERAPGLFAQRLTITGDAAWAADGVPVAEASFEELARPVVVFGGADGVIVAWVGAGAGGRGIFAARLDAAGERSWQRTVHLLGTGTRADSLRAVAMPDGGAVLAWRETYDDASQSLRVERLGRNGQLHWAAREPAVGRTPGAKDHLALAADGRGGAFLCWGEQRSDGHVFALRFEASGKPARAWPSGGAPVCGPTATVSSVQLVPDGDGGAIAVWTDDRRLWGAGFRVQTVLAMKLLRNAVAAPPPPGIVSRSPAPLAEPPTWVPLPESFAIRALGPNPGPRGSRLRFVLPDATPADIELFDIGGRKVWSQEVGGLGAGEHTVRIAEGAWLPPGGYVVRLSQGGHSTVTRVTIVR